MAYYKSIQREKLSLEAKCFNDQLNKVYLMKEITIYDLDFLSVDTLKNMNGGNADPYELLKKCKENPKLNYLVRGILYDKNWEYLSANDLNKLYVMSTFIRKNIPNEYKIKHLLEKQLDVLCELYDAGEDNLVFIEKCKEDLKNLIVDEKTLYFKCIYYNNKEIKLVTLEAKDNNLLIPKCDCKGQILTSKQRGEYIEFSFDHNDKCDSDRYFIKMDESVLLSDKNLTSVRLEFFKDCISKDLSNIKKVLKT